MILNFYFFFLQKNKLLKPITIFGKFEKYFFPGNLFFLHSKYCKGKNVVTVEGLGEEPVYRSLGKIPRYINQGHTFNPTRVAKTCNARDTFAGVVY